MLDCRALHSRLKSTVKVPLGACRCSLARSAVEPPLSEPGANPHLRRVCSPAPQAELEQLARDGLAQDDQLLQTLTHPAPYELPWFAGAHVYPLYPGSAAK